MSWRIFLAVLMGGSAGALTRAAVHFTLFDGSALALLGVNTVGSFLMGIFAGRLIDSPTVKAGVGVGFCGALTSMSTFAVDVAERLIDGRIGSALLFASATVGLAVLGAAVGLRLGESS